MSGSILSPFFSRHKPAGPDSRIMDKTERLFEKYRSLDSTTCNPPGSSPFTLVDYLLGIVLKFIHRFLHLISWYRYNRFQNSLVGRIFYGLMTGMLIEGQESNEECINEYNRKSLLIKQPHHLAININETSVDRDKLAQIVAWCSRLDSLKTLTIYHSLFGEDETKEEMVGSLKVCRIGYQAGHQSLVEAAKNLCSIHSKTSEKDSTAEFSGIIAEEISQQLRHQYPFTDPDFMICFGDGGADTGIKFNSLNSFPMWQIRLTEIVFLSVGHRLVSCRQFCQALERFACCQQRLGT